MLLETPRDINHCNGTVRRLTQLLVELTIDSYGLTGSAPPLQFSASGVSIWINTLNENIIKSQLKIDSSAFLQWRAKRNSGSDASVAQAASKRAQSPQEGCDAEEGRGRKRACTPSRQQMQESSGSSSSDDEGAVGHTHTAKTN